MIITYFLMSVVYLLNFVNPFLLLDMPLPFMEAVNTFIPLMNSLNEILPITALIDVIYLYFLFEIGYFILRFFFSFFVKVKNRVVI